MGLSDNMFDNVARIRRVACPTLIIHGALDSTVNVRESHALAAACGADAVERRAVALNIRQGLSHNGFDVQKDIARPMWDAFPNLHQGDPLPLSNAPNWLLRQAVWVAPDVAQRVPYQYDA